MKQLLTLSLGLMISLPLQPSELNQPAPVKHPEMESILTQIKKNNPTLKPQFAQKLAQAILKKSKKYHLSAKVLSAILMQESGYKISAQNLKCGISITTGKQDCVAVDFGIGQINHKTIKSFNFDKNKLLNDLEYSVDASAKVLADFKRMYGKKDQEFWTRYNSSTPEKRHIYKQLVARHM